MKGTVHPSFAGRMVHVCSSQANLCLPISYIPTSTGAIPVTVALPRLVLLQSHKVVKAQDHFCLN